MKDLQLTNRRFERWLVIGKASPIQGRSRWLCRCDCGTERPVRQTKLVNGLSRSCGCIQREAQAIRRRSHGCSGVNATPEYRTWRGIKTRCHNPKSRDFEHYGAQGITVCERWFHSFENFLSDMGPRPKGKYTLDRIDSSKGYSPENCRWATWIEQQNHRSTSSYIELQGRVMTFSQWERELGLPAELIGKRLHQGWSEEMALQTPIRQTQTYSYGGKTLTVPEWCKVTGMAYGTLKERIRRGWDFPRAITERIHRKPA